MLYHPSLAIKNFVCGLDQRARGPRRLRNKAPNSRVFGWAEKLLGAETKSVLALQGSVRINDAQYLGADWAETARGG